MVHSNFQLAKIQGQRPPQAAQMPTYRPPEASEEGKDDDLPPPYEPGPSGPPYQPQAQAQPQAAPPTPTTVPPSADRPNLGSLYAQKVLGIYHASSFGNSDTVISRSADDPNPIFWVGTHGVFSNQADLTLHAPSRIGQPSQGYKVLTRDSPTIGSADFQPFSSSFVVQLFELTGSGVQTGGVTVDKRGWIHPSWGFSVRLPETGRVEAFEWRRADGPAVQALEGGWRGGMECVAGNGQVVAAFATPSSMSIKKVGKLQFFPRRGGGMGPQGMVPDEGWGEGVEGLVLMALLGLKEKERRQRNNRRSNAG